MVALAAFVAVQARSAHPLLPLRILASRNRGGAYASITLAMLARLPVRAIVVPGLLLSAAGAALLTQLAQGASYAGLVLPAELLLGIGLGLSVMPLFATATREADPADAGATGAAANMAQQVGASVGTAVLNTITATATAAYVTGHHGLFGAATAAATAMPSRASGRRPRSPSPPWLPERSSGPCRGGRAAPGDCHAAWAQ